MPRPLFRIRACLPSTIALILAVHAAAIAAPIKVSCIGNSITDGGYPAKLAAKLGPAYLVENHGVGGTTLLKKGDKPYWTQGKLAASMASKPDIVTIKLGTNDSKSWNWVHKADFAKDLTALVDTLAALPSKPQIWLCLPSPSFTTGTDINGTIIREEIIPLIKQVAAAKQLEIIDIQTPLQAHPQLFPDKIHPNDAGADSIASIIYRTIAAKSTRIACIGNSITQYVNTVTGPTPASDAYAAKLNMLFGRGYITVNHGVSGAYCMKSGPSPYWNTGRIPQVLAFKPQVVTVKLGTNDSRSQYWNRDHYIRDLSALVDTLHSINPKPTVWLLLPVPAWKRNGVDPFNGINGNIIRDQVIPAIKEVARLKGVKTIDAYTPFLTLERLVPDGVHPIAEGQDSLARIIHRAMTATPTALRRAVPTPANGASRVERRRDLPFRIPWLSGLWSADGRSAH